MSRSKIEAKLRREKEKASVLMICLDSKPPYTSRLQWRHIRCGTLLRSSRTSMEEEVGRGSTLSISLILWELMLTTRICTWANSRNLWWIGLILGTSTWSTSFHFLNTKFFYADGRFTLPSLGPTHQFLGEDLHGYVQRFSLEKH